MSATLPVHRCTPVQSYYLYLIILLLNRMMDHLDIKQFSFSHSKNFSKAKIQRLPRHEKGEYFLKGPIPWNWLTKAACLPGKALHIANIIWFLAGMKNKRTIKLPSKRLQDWGVSRFSKRRGLGQLEMNGLVSVERNNGRNPVVTILEIKDPKF